MYSIPVGSLIEVQIVGRLHGQRTRNVFHYKQSGEDPLPDGATALLAFLDEWNTEVLTALAAMMSNEQEYEFLTAQMIKETRYRAVFRVPDPQFGSVMDSALPTVNCAVISLFNDHSGHRFQGRKYLSGIPVTEEEDSKLSPAFQTALDDLGSRLASQITPADGSFWDPTLETGRSELVPADQSITDWLARDIIRVQRRREIGVGE